MPTLLRRVGVLCVLLSGCSLDSEGTAGDLESLADTGELDTSNGDTSTTPGEDGDVPDTTTGDVEVDTSVPPPDTGTPDTGPIDTGVVDTAPETPITTPSLTGESGQLTGDGKINVSTEGSIEWAHWGQGDDANAWNHKSGGTALIKGAIGSAKAWGTMPTQITWTGGTPTGSVTDSRWGIYHENDARSFAFEAVGDPAVERTLRVYATWNGAAGTVDAKLSDATLTWTGKLPPPGAPGGIGTIPAWFQFKFKPATSGGKLQIKITQNGNAGYIGLIAATLK